ncbi:penicillin-binding transpeptidase domain-containing protein [Streptomyces sp. NPDC091292]|uniref:penicillin-binding transpeptidase domain-containing protein n=1 Tax=Streptomyces sp. NPDC091292 TaxID=3365991 RepID=UPI0037F28FD6
MGKRRRAARRRTHPALVGGAVAVLVGGGAIAAYTLYGGGTHADAVGDAKPVPKGPPTAAEVRTVAEGFLTAWGAGNAARAAALTDDPAAATKALTGYRKDARISAVTLTPGTRAGAKMPFSVKATVSYGGKTKPLAYASELTVVRRASDGEVLVGWAPSVVHPDLGDGDRLVTGASGTPPIKALDRAGGELTPAEFPSLAGVLDGLREKYGKTAGGKAGVELRLVRADSAASKDKGTDASAKSDPDTKAADKTLVTLSKGTPGTVKTTLSPTAQATAEQQVRARERASVVVLKPSTGEILAVANSNAGGFNTAFQGSLAPGSTMKIVSASLLLEKDLASIDKPHPCPKYASYGGWKFQNLEKFQIKDGTFRASFAASCNTAFITQAKELSDDALTKQAQEVFGLGRDNWAVGVSTFDGSVPVQKDASKAASLIGQGGVRMNPLNVASIVATAKTGVFRQPYLVPPDVDDRTLAKASRVLSGSAQSQLRELLRYTATSGTAAKAMAGLGSDIGGKTGSAEVDGQKKPNGWFTAWRGDVASAAVVLEGGHGGESAGPLVAAMLRAGGG